MSKYPPPPFQAVSDKLARTKKERDELLEALVLMVGFETYPDLCSKDDRAFALKQASELIAKVEK